MNYCYKYPKVSSSLDFNVFVSVTDSWARNRKEEGLLYSDSVVQRNRITMGLLLNLLQTLKDGNIGEGLSLAWNPLSGIRIPLRDGAYEIPLSLAFCGSKCRVRVWHLIPHFQMHFVGHLMAVASVAWSPCGLLLAVTSILDDLITIYKNQSVASVLDRARGIELLTFYGPREYEGEDKMIRVCWSASGSLLATCGGKYNSISIWKINIANITSRPLLASPRAWYTPIKQGIYASKIPGNHPLTSAWRIEPDDELELVAYLREHAGDVNCVQWHPKKDVLFSCSSDHTIKVWIDQEQDGRNNWQCVQTLGQPQNGHNSAVWSLAFNTSGDRMVTSSDDGTLKIWEVMRPSNNIFLHWNNVYTLTRCHDGAIFSVHWSRQGIIATGGADGTIGLFGQIIGSQTAVAGPVYQLLLKEKKHDQRINSVQWSPGDHRLLASTGADETIKLWKLEQANEEVESNFRE